MTKIGGHLSQLMIALGYIVLPSTTIIECLHLFQDCRVMIWTNDGTSSKWSSTVLNKFKDVVWHLSWSITGNILAVSGGDNKVKYC